MRIIYDPVKSEKNQRERGLPFSLAEFFDWESAFVIVDNRKDYGEIRYIALGFIHDRLHVMCFTRIKKMLRIISLRKANKREGVVYEKKCTTDK
jgi:uncharacterized DUF497 family protein